MAALRGAVAGKRRKPATARAQAGKPGPHVHVAPTDRRVEARWSTTRTPEPAVTVNATQNSKQGNSQQSSQQARAGQSGGGNSAEPLKGKDYA